MPVRFRLREILEDRERQGRPLSQSELARLSRVSFATVNRMATNATRRVDLDVIDKLCKVLKVKPGALFHEE